MIVKIENIGKDIMKGVDFAENELYMTICGKKYNNIFNVNKKRPLGKAVSAGK